jgi:site-specific recombinase XerD
VTAEPLRALDGGRGPRGWEALWATDTWRQRDLPHGDLASTYRGEVLVRFDGLEQPWVKEAAKRWARVRLLGDTTPRTMSLYLTDLRHFSGWLAEHAPAMLAPAMLTRAVLEDYILWVRRHPDWRQATRQRRVIALRAFLDEQAADGLDGLPRSAVIHRGEVPRVDYRLPKQMPDDVFAQWIDPSNLALLKDELQRTVVLVLAFTGFRVSSVVTLLRDARTIGSDGHPYLRYRNIKAKRQAALPIPSVLSEQLDRHETFLRERYPDGTDWLIPSPPVGERHGKGGGYHLSHSAVQRIVKHYIRTAEIRTADGQLALGVHPHLFRHHLASSMVAEEIPLLVVQKVLDHGSVEMTAHYGRVHDSTIKQAVWKFHERVNIRGERIALPVDGPLEEAAWMKERIACAKQALPNGYCGLPLVQSCPHPNACLSCPSFLTDESFRRVHEQQRAQTRRLLDTAREANNVRLVELLQRDDDSLRRILEGLDAIESDRAAEIDIRDLVNPAGKERAA